MGFLARLLGTEKREGVRTSDPYLAEYFGFRGSFGQVSPDAILSNSAVAVRCISLRSELLASVGLHVFRRSGNGGRDRANDLSLYSVLHDTANETQSAFELRELMIRCLDLHGNFYARVVRNTKAQVVSLRPLLPGTVTVEKIRATGRLRYKVMNSVSGTETLLQDEILHVRGPSRDGIVGQSPVQIARGTLALGLRQKELASSLMTNAMRPSGILSIEQKLNDVQVAQVKAQIQNGFSGTENAGRVLVLGSDAKYSTMSFTPEDAEFLDSMKLSNEDTARIFGVPPTAVGILDRGTYSNTEQEAASLIQNCLGPLAARIEAALSRCLLTSEARRTLYVEHDLSGLLRGDVKSRFEAYRMGREIGALSANDVRKRENEPPIDGGDQYHMPSNWMPLGTTPGNAAQ